MLLAIGCGAPQTVINAAAAQGAKVITLPVYPRLGAPVSSHADLLIHPLGGALYTFGDYYRSFAEEEINRICDGAGLELRFIGADAGSVYPTDVPLCAKRVGDFFWSHARRRPSCATPQPGSVCTSSQQSRDIPPVRLPRRAAASSPPIPA